MSSFVNQLSSFAQNAPVHRSENKKRGPTFKYRGFLVGMSSYNNGENTEYKYVVQLQNMDELSRMASELEAKVGSVTSDEYDLPFKAAGPDAILVFKSMALKLEKGSREKPAKYQEDDFFTSWETDPDRFTLRNGDHVTNKCWSVQKVKPFTQVIVSGFNFVPLIKRDLTEAEKADTPPYTAKHVRFFTNTDMIETDVNHVSSSWLPEERVAVMGDVRSYPMLHPLDPTYTQELPHLIYAHLDETQTTAERAQGVDGYTSGGFFDLIKYGRDSGAPDVEVEYKKREAAFAYDQLDTGKVGGLSVRPRLAIRSKAIRWFPDHTGKKIISNTTVDTRLYSDDCRELGIVVQENYKALMAQFAAPLTVVFAVNDKKSSESRTTNIFELNAVGVAWHTLAYVKRIGVPVSREWVLKFFGVKEGDNLEWTEPVEKVKVKGNGFIMETVSNEFNQQNASRVLNLSEFNGPTSATAGPEWAFFALYAKRTGFIDDPTLARMAEAREKGPEVGDHVMDDQILDRNNNFNREKVHNENAIVVFAVNTAAGPAPADVAASAPASTPAPAPATDEGKNAANDDEPSGELLAADELDDIMDESGVDTGKRAREPEGDGAQDVEAGEPKKKKAKGSKRARK